MTTLQQKHDHDIQDVSPARPALLAVCSCDYSLSGLDTVQEFFIELNKPQIAAQTPHRIVQLPWLGCTEGQGHPCMPSLTTFDSPNDLTPLPASFCRLAAQCS